MLVTAAAICILLMLIAGGLVYANTRRTITAADWVEHTQEVLNSLRTASQMSDRVDSSAHLYAITSDTGRLDQARSSANLLETQVSRLKTLIAENPTQAANVQQMLSCSTDVTRAVTEMHAGDQFPVGPVQRCQQTIARMTEQERQLLAERTKASQRISVVSLTSDFVFVGLSVLALTTLFGFLLRAADLRQRGENLILKANRDLEESIQKLKEQADETSLLSTLRDELQLCVNLQEVYECARSGFSRLGPGTCGALCMTTNSRNIMETVISWGEIAREDCHPPESCCSLRSGQLRWREPAGSEIHCGHFGDDCPERYVCVPMLAHGDTLGLLYVQYPTAESMALARHRLPALRQLLQLTGMAIASMRLRIKLEQQSIRDPLTNLFNRHFMEVALERELSLAARRSTMLAVMMLDIDHFKDFNDTHGHAAGDTVLQAVAEVCRETVRTEDIVCRYGGEELTIILPDIDPQAAFARAEGIRTAVAALRVSDGKESYGEVTMSIGIALYPNSGTSSEALLRRADQALYHAKRQGRDQVQLAEDPIFATPK
jgi:diguanylate cyclase (GGDEF)-like protein